MLTCNGLDSHPVGLAMFSVTWFHRDKLQLDGLHGSGVDLLKFCLSTKFYTSLSLYCNF